MKTNQIFLTLCLVCAVGATAQTRAKEDSPKGSKTADNATCSVQGRVSMPGEVSEAINTEGLSLDKVVITLKGKYNHPKMPYPAEWREMKPEERTEWRNAFMDTDGYKVYLRAVEEARAKRQVYKTELAEDGSFTFANVKPAWYELAAIIMHPDAEDDRSLELARAHAMRQFFVRKNDKPSYVNLTLRLKNVLTPGDQAPDWTATAYDGSEFKLSDFRGKFVLFDFWATWCGTCRAEFPNLEAVFKDYGGERFETIGLSVDETIDAARSALEESPVAYRQGWVGDLKRHEEIAEAHGFQSIPSIWLIGPNGKIIARDLHREKIREAVMAALKDQADEERHKQ